MKEELTYRQIILSKGKGTRYRPEGPEGGRGIALIFPDLGARRGWVVSTTPRPLYPEKDPVPIVQEAGWAPGPVWTCEKNLAPTRIRSPDRPARSQSLYRIMIYRDEKNKNSNKLFI
jgi:hypothetical protein